MSPGQIARRYYSKTQEEPSQQYFKDSGAGQRKVNLDDKTSTQRLHELLDGHQGWILAGSYLRSVVRAGRTDEEEKLSHGEKQRLWIEAQMQCTSRDDATTIRRKNGCFKKPCAKSKLHSIVLFMVAYRLARNYHSRPKQLAADEDVALEAVLVFNIVYCEC